MAAKTLSVLPPRSSSQKSVSGAKPSKRKLSGGLHELRFSSRADFHRFVKNMGVLILIARHSPKSVYELSKRMRVNVSNLGKVVTFFERVGVVKLTTAVARGRTLKAPTLIYDKIEFNLNPNGDRRSASGGRLLRIARTR